LVVPIAEQSLEAGGKLPGDMMFCSWRSGWRALLLRGYDEPTEVESLVTAPTTDHLLVLVTGGSCRIEGRYAGRWHQARYARGDIGMTAPGEEVQLRWHDGRALSTLQLHIPATTFADVRCLDPESPKEVRLPHQLLRPDDTVERVVASLRRAADAGAPELYADSALHFLANHLLHFHTTRPEDQRAHREGRRMAAAEAMLRENIGRDVTLDALASTVGLSKFHLLRVFKATYGETPFQRLTRLRMEEARRLLGTTSTTILEISYLCGYENPTHFATAFRRTIGVSPSEYRAQSRQPNRNPAEEHSKITSAL
jgi:AraC family transcriptional regulator